MTLNDLEWLGLFHVKIRFRPALLESEPHVPMYSYRSPKDMPVLPPILLALPPRCPTQQKSWRRACCVLHCSRLHFPPAVGLLVSCCPHFFSRSLFLVLSTIARLFGDAVCHHFLMCVQAKGDLRYVFQSHSRIERAMLPSPATKSSSLPSYPTTTVQTSLVAAESVLGCWKHLLDSASTSVYWTSVVRECSVHVLLRRRRRQVV